jgi:tetratricopeptide (TPR) repeat protein
MKIVTILLIYFFTITEIFGQENARFINEKAEKLADIENYKDALKEYNNCVKNYIDESNYFKVEVLLNKARIENKLKEFDKAEKSIRDAISIKKSLHSIYVTQAEIFATQNKCKEAYWSIDTAIFYNKNETELLLKKADYQLKALMVDSALNTANKFIALEPKNLNAYVLRSSIYLMKKEYSNGIEDANYVLHKNPDNLEALLNRGTLLAQNNEFNKAETDFYRIINLNHNYKAASLNNIAFFIKFKQQDFKSAIDILNQALQTTPNQAYLLNNRGYANLMLKNYDEAIKDINESIKLDPYNSYAYKYLALYYLEMNKKRKACDNIDKALKLGYTQEHDKEVDELRQKTCK